jgi:hypothetical protein
LSFAAACRFRTNIWRAKPSENPETYGVVEAVMKNRDFMILAVIKIGIELGIIWKFM